MECLLATLIIIFPRRYPAKRSSRIRAWFNQRRLNRLPVVCLPLKLKRFQLNLSDTDISPAFTRDFRIFVFAILPTLSLSLFLLAFLLCPKEIENECTKRSAHIVRNQTALQQQQQKEKPQKEVYLRLSSSKGWGGGKARRVETTVLLPLAQAPALVTTVNMVAKQARTAFAQLLPLIHTHVHTHTHLHSVWRTLWVKLNAWTFNMAIIDKAVRSKRWKPGGVCWDSVL